MKNYTADYGLGRVQSVGVDDAHNIWLLDGARIGVLRPGDTRPTWTTGGGQASPGFGPDKLATGSTVICGGAAGQAYVGYAAEENEIDPKYPDLHPAYIVGPGETGPNGEPFDEARWRKFQQGDLDVVRLGEDGTVVLEEHLGRSVGFGYKNIGIRNTNDWHYDEDRSVLVCRKVMKGPFKGELYIGTNHGVTRVRGLEYNSHRHPVWDVNGSLRIGFNYAVGIGQNGDLLIGNEWKIGILEPTAELRDFDRHAIVPYKLNTHADEVNDLPTMDHWRGFEQTTDGAYYLASKSLGLWRMSYRSASDSNSVKVAGLPTDALNALAATDDGSLFIGTSGHGLWRLTSGKQLQHISVAGSTVRELLYDPTVAPAMLYVLTDAGLTVLRGY